MVPPSLSQDTDGRGDDARGKEDIFVAFATADGGMTKSVNLVAGVNSDDSDSCPNLSADGKYFFF